MRGNKSWNDILKYGVYNILRLDTSNGFPLLVCELKVTEPFYTRRDAEAKIWERYLAHKAAAERDGTNPKSPAYHLYNLQVIPQVRRPSQKLPASCKYPVSKAVYLEKLALWEKLGSPADMSPLLSQRLLMGQWGY